MAYTFVTFSPSNNSQVPCNVIPGRTISSYWYVTQSDNRIQLVAYNQTDNLPPNVYFNVQFTGENGNQAIISFIGEDGNTYYFMASGNDVIYTSSSTDASLWYLYQFGSNPLTPTTNLDYSIFYVQLVGTNTYMINYIKNSSGSFEANNYLTLDVLPEGQTPVTLQRGNASCNYTFTSAPLDNTDYNVVASNPNNQIEDLKFNILTVGENVTATAYISKWGNNQIRPLSNSNSNSNSDKLLIATGTKNRFSEFGFNSSYDVKLTINSKILSCGRKVNEINSVLSMFEITENYIILEVYENYFLLTTEITPSYSKLRSIRKRFEEFVHLSKSCNKHV